MAVLLGAQGAHAGAWPTTPGETQVILKYEGEQASQAFDPKSGQVAIPHLQDDDVAVFVEHGLTSQLTFQGQAAYTWGEDQYIRYSGAGPTQFGLRYAVFDSGRTVASVYVGAIAPGQGRNAEYALPNQGDWAGEVRLLLGQSFDLRGSNLFFDVEAARLFRSQLPDETHVDLTAGLESGPWMGLVQVYAGQADYDPVSPRWAQTELSLVRRFDHWRVQGGWRQTVAGRESPVGGGPILAVWRRF
jgi:hypothetical protein